MKRLDGIQFLENDSISVLFDPESLIFYSLDTRHAAALKREKFVNMEAKEGDDVLLEEIVSMIRVDKAIARKNIDEQMKSGNTHRVLNRLTLVVTSSCNLRCTYCYESNERSSVKLGYPSPTVMTPEIGRKAINDYLSHYDYIRTVMFFGGEPTLEIDLVDNLAEYTIQRASELGKKTPSFGIITNGTRIDVNCIKVFKKLSFQVTVSLDGNRFYHDLNRVYADGHGSFDHTIDGITAMQRAGIAVTVQSTLTPEAIDGGVTPYNVAEFLMQRFHIMNPHIVPAQYSRSSWRSWTEAQAQSLVEVYAKSSTKNIENIEHGNIKDVKTFSYQNAILQGLVSRRWNPFRCPAGIEAAVSPDGGYYPCFMMIGDEEMRLGGVSDGINSEYEANLSVIMEKNLKSRNSECSSCWIRGLCSACLGGSLKAGGSLEANDHNHCEIMRRMVSETILSLATIANDPVRWRDFVANVKTMRGGSAETVC